jgi:lipid A 3-O-deacylase
MDGTMAALVLGLSLVDMGINHCPTDCFGAEDAAPRWALSGGAVIFQSEVEAAELYLRRDFGVLLGPFQPSLGASVTSEGSTWLGAGILYTLEGPLDLYFQGHIMPGAYFPADGRDLGGGLQFRSGIEFGYEAPSGLRLGLSLDHRSNADRLSYNPGLETVQLRVTWPMD